LPIKGYFGHPIEACPWSLAKIQIGITLNHLMNEQIPLKPKMNNRKNQRENNRYKIIAIFNKN
jgi:hypothetical protein